MVRMMLTSRTLCHNTHVCHIYVTTILKTSEFIWILDKYLLFLCQVALLNSSTLLQMIYI